MWLSTKQNGITNVRAVYAEFVYAALLLFISKYNGGKTMADLIKVNGRTVRAADVDFNFIADLQENGIDISKMGRKIIPTLRVYVAKCFDVDVETAGDMIQAHMENGGKIDSIMDVLGKKVEESRFFRILGATAEETTIEKDEVVEVESTKVAPIKKTKKTSEA